MNGGITYNKTFIGYDKLSQFVSGLKFEGLHEWESEFFRFIRDFLSDQEVFVVQTSGSTGEPKRIEISKSDLIKSARFTNEYLKLNSKTIALSCLPTKYIAGKMMFVRAYIGDFNLIVQKPASNPIAEGSEQIDFVALTPFQVEKILASTECAERLQKIESIIIGGSAPGANILSTVRNWTNNVYSTYGMTETLSHVALSKLNSKTPRVFHSVNDAFKFECDERDCLVISTPYKHAEKLITNDVVKLNADKTFRWLGRADNIINSGGIKINPESVEAKLEGLINVPFIIASEGHSELENQLILLIESKNNYYDSEDFLQKVSAVLEKYERPRKIRCISQFNRLANDKIDRLNFSL